MFEKSNINQIEALQVEIGKLREANKNGSAELAAERGRAGEIQAELARVLIELEASKQSVLKARKRQKNSVERANRFKLKVVKLAELTTS